MGEESDREPDVEASLLARVEEAVEAADQLRDESELVVAGPNVLREIGLTTRCAWCGRYRVAEQWIVLKRVPIVVSLAEEATTHGICPDCVASLRAAGLSA